MVEAPSPLKGRGLRGWHRGRWAEGTASLLHVVRWSVPRARPWLDPSGLLTTEPARQPPADASGDVLGFWPGMPHGQVCLSWDTTRQWRKPG